MVQKQMDAEDDEISYDERFEKELVSLRPKFTPYVDGGGTNVDDISGGVFSPRTSRNITRSLIITAVSYI